MLKVLELFSGTGCQVQALKNIGIECVSTQCEIDKYAISAYNQLHGETPNLGDISKVNPDNLQQGQWDLITYSFPCQSISIAGKQAGLAKNSGTTSSLLWECEKIIRKVKPKYLLMENVANLLSDKFKPFFYSWLKTLEEMGYCSYYDVLNAKDFGIPQNRERIFCVSILGKHVPYVFPQKQPLKLRLKDMLEDKPDEKYYLSNDKIDKISRWSSYQKPLERVLGKNSIAPTLTARGAGEEHSGMITYCDEIENTTNFQDEMRDIKEPLICASRGRNPENPSDRTVGSPTEQRIEINKQGIANTLTTVQKDNLVIEPKNPLKGKTEYGWHFEQQVYDANGIARTIKAGGGSGNIPKVMEEPKIERIGGMYGQATRWGVYSEEGISPTITASMGLGGGHVPMVETHTKCLNSKGGRGNNPNAQPSIQNRVYDSNAISPAITTCFRPNITDNTERLSKQAYETLEENKCKDGDVINPFNKKVVEDGICPTITTRPEGFKTANLIVVDESIEPNLKKKIEKEKENIANSNKDIYNIKSNSGFNDNAIGLKISPTIRAARPSSIGYETNNNEQIPQAHNFRIRKLTVRECWRLMGWKDEQFDKIYKKEIYWIEGDKEKCNVNLKIVPEKQQHIGMETYVLCTIKDLQDMEILRTIKKLLINKPKKNEMQHVNIVIEKLVKVDHLVCATNIIKCFTFMGMHYTLIEGKDQHHMVIIAQGKEDKVNTEKNMKITIESNLDLLKLYTILILIGQIMKLKIFGSITQEVNICGYMQIIESYEKNIILKILNLKMEIINQSISSSQLYKMAGNGIVINVLEAIFTNMFLRKPTKEEEKFVVDKPMVQMDLF